MISLKTSLHSALYFGNPRNQLNLSETQKLCVLCMYVTRFVWRMHACMQLRTRK